MFLGVNVMSSLKNRILKATALSLALAVMHVCVSAELVRAVTSRLVASVASPQGAAQGRLVTRGNNAVTVNGNPAKTGETIFSGQRITTPAGTQANVDLPGLGTLEIKRGSDVTLTFGEGRVVVVVLSGCVELETEKGVTGTVESKGRTQTTDPQKRDEIDTCDDAGVLPGQVTAAAAGGLGSGTATALTAAIVGTFAVIAHEFVSDSDNPEPAPCTPIPGTTSPLTPPSGCAP
jgi:hypothetical protein